MRMIRSARSTTSSSRGWKTPFVVLSVGGFSGMGSKLVVLPYQQLKTMDRKIVMPGASRDALKDLAEFLKLKVPVSWIRSRFA